MIVYRNRITRNLFPSLMLLGMFARPSAWLAAAQPEKLADIRTLSQQFIDTHEKIDPWMFYPKDNLKIFSTTAHRGLLYIEDAGKGEDIRDLRESHQNRGLLISVGIQVRDAPTGTKGW